MRPALRTLLFRLTGFTVLLEAMLVGAILYWPTFREHIGRLRGLVPLPVVQNLLQAVETGGLGAYVAGQHFFKGCNTLGTAAAVLFAAGAVAGEAHRGTLEVWLARPLSRRRILLERWGFGALAVVLPIFLTTLSIPWLLTYVDDRLPLRPLLLGAVHQSAFLLAFYSLTFLFSTLGRSALPIATAVLFLSTFEFAIYLVERVTHYSIFRLADMERFMRIFRTGGLEMGLVTALALASLVCLGASLFAFERRVP
jgi:ABC-type transport system involved in multi-copper enzyme maturation permease subunit